MFAQCIIDRSPLSPPCPAVSCKSTTQSAVTRYTATLAYTGKERSMKSSVPPKRGAIMPPLWRALMSHDPSRKKGSYGGRTFEITPMRFHTPFRVLWYQRSRASTYDTVQPTFHSRENARLNPYNTAYIVYPIRESVNVTKIASNRNSPWRSD